MMQLIYVVVLFKSYRFLKCTETNKNIEKKKLVVFNEMPI